MDTSDSPGAPHPDALAHAMDPDMEEAMAAALARISNADLSRMMEPVLAGIAHLTPSHQQLQGVRAAIAAAAPMLAQAVAGLDMDRIMRSAGPTLTQVAQLVGFIDLTIDDATQQALTNAVNQAFTTADVDDGLLEPVTDPELAAVLNDVDLGALGEAGRAFVAREGRGLSWEMQQRLFVWFMSAVALLLLMQVMVANDTANAVITIGATAMPLVSGVATAAKKGFGQLVPRPEGDDTETAPNPGA